jgi:betaine reductase
MKRVMIIGKGSLFLARLTNLADGGSFMIESPRGIFPSPSGAVGKEDVKALILEALADIAAKLSQGKAD